MMKYSVLFLAMTVGLSAGAADAAKLDSHSHEAVAGKKAYHGYANYLRASEGHSKDDMDAMMAHAYATSCTEP